MSAKVRPGWFLIVCSLAVFGAGLFLLANALAALTVTWDGLTMIGGMVLMPLALALCVQQYRGTIGRVCSAAKFTTLMLAILGAFAAMFLVGTFVEFQSAEYEIPWILFASVLALALGGFAAAWANYRWAKVLQQQEEPPPARTGRDVAAGIVAGVVTAFLTAYLVHATPPRYAEHAEYETPPFGIPSEAIDISFCRGARGMIAYEFSIDEAGFRKWFEAGIGTVESAAADIPLLRIDEPFTITCYSRLAAELTGPDAVTIDQGLYYSWSLDDRSVQAAYDAASGRAYYYFCSY